MSKIQFKTRAPWFILAIAIIAGIGSGRSEAATPEAPAAASFRDLQVQVVGSGKPVLMKVFREGMTRFVAISPRAA